MTTEDDKKRDPQAEPGSDTETHGDPHREQASTGGQDGTDSTAVPQSTPSDESAASPASEGPPAGEPPAGDERPEEPRPPEEDDETRRGGRPIAVAALVIALLVAVGVGLGGYELWQNLRQLRGAQQDMVSAQALQQRSEQLSRRIDTVAGGSRQLKQELEQRLAGLDDSVSQLAGRLDQRAQQAGALADQIETLRQQHRSLAGRVDEAIAMASSDGDDWRRAEAGYLASVAVYRVRFHGDVEGALRALGTADELLAAADAPPAALRQALAAASDRLNAVTLPDREALASRIEDLEAGISQWPLQSGVESVAAKAQSGAAAPDPAQAPGWRQALTRAWEQVKASLGQLVVVQREGKSLPLVSPAERFFLEQNLRLRLESARMALLAGDEALYQRSLERVQSWLERYFDTSVPEVRKAVSEASALAAASITPQLPDLSSTLEPLTRLD